MFSFLIKFSVVLLIIALIVDGLIGAKNGMAETWNCSLDKVGELYNKKLTDFQEVSFIENNKLELKNINYTLVVTFKNNINEFSEVLMDKLSSTVIKANNYHSKSFTDARYDFYEKLFKIRTQTNTLNLETINQTIGSLRIKEL